MAQSTKKKTAQKQAGLPSWTWLAVLGVILLVGGVYFVLSNNSGSQLTGLPAAITVKEAAQMREDGAFMLDVREPDEWNQVHIPGATLIPLGDLPNRLDEVPQDQEVVVVCRSGNRSQAGRDILKKAGFAQVTSMDGGMNQWQAMDYPTATGP